jgi:single-strand DNA-binding protein
MNKVILIGRTGKDAEVSEVNGKKKAVFTMATKEFGKNSNGERVELATWHNIECWDKLAEICGNYVKKGGMVAVEGRIKVDQWEKDGQKHSRTYILAGNIELLTPKKEQDGGQTSGNAGSAQNAQNDGEQYEEGGDDLPF